ncbi:MAG TPA: transcriptional regulator, partial [Porphyromonadaceae bacterium]|nr:transcriptional regulator [Porphyromonadaceae bacterium]
CPISSIVLEVEKGGYEAGRLIDRLIKKEREEPFDIVINPVRFELRKSTERYDIANEYVLKVVKYIEKHYKEDIAIDYLTELIPLSRRSLEVKFKEEMGTSIYQFVLNCRIENFANLLATTNLSLYEMALESGFADCKNVSRLFKKAKGCTPADYRLRIQSYTH